MKIVGNEYVNERQLQSFLTGWKTRPDLGSPAFETALIREVRRLRRLLTRFGGKA